VNERSPGIAPPRHRLPDATRVGAVRLQVADLERSLEWYGRVIGLATLDRSADSAVLGAGARPLVRLHARSGARPVPRRGAFGLFHFAILLPERAALGRFLAHLVGAGVRPGMADHLVSEALYLHDPDGLGIEVYADRPRAAWREVDGELAMATDPLDVRDLLAAGGETPWSGAPDGTVMGHLHLHVGDLAAARAFYHEALGLDVMVQSYPGALFLAAGGYHHHLGVNTWSPGPGAAPDEARLMEWALVLPGERDVAAAAESLAAAGHRIETRDDGARGVADPWGTRLRIATSD
jgi:catechol 2,3-dioxygenase